VTSVCTGALVLHGAGLIADRRVTTHWAAIEELRGLAPDLTVLDNVRYVRDGDVVTSAGVSAGIDMSLHVVAKLLGVESARETARYMEYEGVWERGMDD
jgi:transcriptional regulator GlxA family with amidase domain